MVKDQIFLLLATLAGATALGILYFKVSREIDAQAKMIRRAVENAFEQIEALLAIYKDTAATIGLPKTRKYAASPDFLRIITRLFLEHSPGTVVECGSGVSTIVMAYMMKRRGQGIVYSLEHDTEFAAATKKQLQMHGLDAFAKVVDAPLESSFRAEKHVTWYSLENLPRVASIDLLVVDGPPAHIGSRARQPAVPLLVSAFSEEAIVLLDDSDRSDEKATVQAWVQDYGLTVIRHLSAEKGVTALQYRSPSAPKRDYK